MDSFCLHVVCTIQFMLLQAVNSVVFDVVLYMCIFAVSCLGIYLSVILITYYLLHPNSAEAKIKTLQWLKVQLFISRQCCMHSPNDWG